MPNHVHVVLIVKLEHSLIEILQKIKGSTSRYCNLALKRSGKFWQHESYDHSIRSNEFERIVAYVLNNPVKACLVKEWKDWPWTYLNPKWREL
jgi:putative transposase